MRFSVIAVAAILVLPLAAAPANACSGAKAQAATADLSAKTKKPAKKVVKMKKEKVEYMRAAPMK